MGEQRPFLSHIFVQLCLWGNLIPFKGGPGSWGKPPRLTDLPGLLLGPGCLGLGAAEGPSSCPMKGMGPHCQNRGQSQKQVGSSSGRQSSQEADLRTGEGRPFPWSTAVPCDDLAWGQEGSCHLDTDTHLPIPAACPPRRCGRHLE